jgi:hypothetical protein
MIDGAGQEDALAASDVLVNVVRRDLRPEIFSIAQELRKPLIQCEVLGTDEYVGTNSEVLRFDPSDPGTLRFRLESVLKTPDRQAARGGITTRFGFEDMARRYEQLSLEAIRAHSKQSSVLARDARGVA